MPQVLHQVLAAGFVVCKFDLGKEFSELVRCQASDNDSNLSNITECREHALVRLGIMFILSFSIAMM